MKALQHQAITLAETANSHRRMNPLNAAPCMPAESKRCSGAETMTMTPREVCQDLQVSRQTLWRLAREGTLVPVRIRGLQRYRRCDVEIYLASLSVHTKPATNTLHA